MEGRRCFHFCPVARRSDRGLPNPTIPLLAVSPFVITVESSTAAAACFRLCDLVGRCRCFQFCLCSCIRTLRVAREIVRLRVHNYGPNVRSLVLEKQPVTLKRGAPRVGINERRDLHGKGFGKFFLLSQYIVITYIVTYISTYILTVLRNTIRIHLTEYTFRPKYIFPIRNTSRIHSEYMQKYIPEYMPADHILRPACMRVAHCCPAHCLTCGGACRWAPLPPLPPSWRPSLLLASLLASPRPAQETAQERPRPACPCPRPRILLQILLP